MTLEDTRTRPRAARPKDDPAPPLGEAGARVRDRVGVWMSSPSFDFYALLVVGGLLIGMGLLMVASSSSVGSIAKGESGFSGLISQGTFALIGLVGLVVAALLPPGFYRKASWLLLGLGLVLQTLVHTPLGLEHGGNRNWLQLGGLTLQPSELLKLALAVWLGMILAHNRDRLHQPFFLAFPVLPVTVLALGLVVWGHDLGTMMVMSLLVGGALWVAGAPRRWFAAVGLLGVIGVTVLALTSANRMGRITVWLQGCSQGGVQCDQYIEGRFGMAEGGWWGVGLGESRQKWGRLPAAEDDFIFAIIGEELGLLGTLLVVALFAMLALILARMIQRTDSAFIQITTGAVSAWIIGQALINMFVVAGLLPVIGVPLPFISSGGSALVASMLALGMLLSFARSEPGAAAAIRSRATRVRSSFTVLPARSGETGGVRRRRGLRARLLRRGAPRPSRSGGSRKAHR